MKSPIFASLALAMATVGLSACQQQPAQDTAPEGMEGVNIANARLVLPAVKGNPGSVYFDVTYSGDDYATLRKVEVAGSTNSMMHDNATQNGVTSMVELPLVNLPKGETLKFEPGGKHVMVMDVDPKLKAGDKVETTFTFAGGDKTTVQATVEAPGGK